MTQATELPFVYPRPVLVEAPRVDLDPWGLEQSYPDGLRYYQHDACEAVKASWAAGNGSVLAVLATGAGKTQLACSLAKREPGRVLVLAHRDELVRQFRERLQQMTGEIVDTEKAEAFASSHARLVVASTDTIRTRNRLNCWAKDHFDLVIADEFHHYVSATYRAVLEHFQPHARILGITATPDRADEKAMGTIADDVAFQWDLPQAITEGFLVPVRGQAVNIHEIDISQVKAGRSADGMHQDELDLAMFKGIDGIVTKTLELFHPLNKTAIAFFPGVKSAEFACSKFNALVPGSAAFLCATTPLEERRKIVEDFKAGRYRYLTNCDVASEGFDAPATDLILMCSPTKSRARYAQRCGRATRVLPGLIDPWQGRDQQAERRAAIAASSKPHALLVDFMGNAGTHDLCTPEDVLGGDYSPAEVKEAKRKAKEGGQCDIMQALNAAREQLSALARSARSRVTATVTTFNPFKSLGIDHAWEQKEAQRWGRPGLTSGQRDLLLARLPKSEHKLIDTMSKQEATRAIAKLHERQKLGLASLKQLAVLAKHGVADQPRHVKITFDGASKAMNYLADNSWGKAPGFDAERLGALARGLL